MSLRLTLGPFAIRGRHGVHEKERKTPNTFTLTLHLTLHEVRATQTDTLADTIDYEQIYALLLEEMNTPARLLEHLAQRIIHRVLALKEIQHAEVVIEKPKIFAHDLNAKAILSLGR